MKNLLPPAENVYWRDYMAKETGTLKVVQNAIEKEYGPLIKWLGEAADETPEVISTGCIGLDQAVGRGGLERGLIAEFFGPEASGKSFLAYSVIKEACSTGHKCAIIDAEHTIDPRLLENIGLPRDKVLVVDGAATGEQNLSIAQKLMETGEFAVVLIDSVAALLPDARADADFDQQFMGLHARLMSAGLQKLAPVVKKTNTLLIFVNQIRFKIGAYGNPETTTGGNALLFYAGYRIHVAGGKSKSSRLVDKGTGEVYGHRTQFVVEKNKRSAPFKSAEVDLIYGMGYDTIGEVIDIGIDVGLIEQSGAWFAYKDHKWQGKEKAKLALQGDDALKSELERQIRTIVSGGLPDPVVEPEPVKEEVEEVKNDKPARKKRAANA
jgi:recombination protein RecA